MAGSQERKAQRAEGRDNGEGWGSGWPEAGGERGAEGRLMSVPEAGAEKVMLILDAW